MRGGVSPSASIQSADFLDKANVVTGRQRKLPKESLDKTPSKNSTVGLACLQLAPVMERYSLSDNHPDPLTSWVSRFCVGFQGTIWGRFDRSDPFSAAQEE
ncbi:hypothetical protein FPOAC2_02041 [Fusarium poae]